MKADRVTMTNRDSLNQEASSYEREDIVAAATNISYGAPIAILRMSGEGSHEKLLKTLKKDTKTTANVLKRARFLDLTTRDLIDDAMVVFFHAPSSYTG
jgi:tRNA U34 5-carboxymethylaminomethyl modifying GTPase MnmE/TrmE